jgi:hypothetical protein
MEESRAPTRADARDVVLRFGFVYWLLFALPFPIGGVPYLAALGDAYGAGRSHVVAWVGARVLHVEIPPGPQNGSGDGMAAWVWSFIASCLATLTAVVWKLARRQPLSNRWRDALHTMLRYFVGATMVTYALVKVIPSQFPANSPSQLLTTYAESSPMGLFWRFMGASPAYSIFGGVLELIGAVLLFWRRTTTLGAVVLVGVLANVVMINLCFDVPVKIFSTHLLAACVVLLAPQVGALARFFLMGQAATLCPSPGLGEHTGRARAARLVAKVVFVGGTFALSGYGSVMQYHTWGPGREPRPLEGIWAVDAIDHGSSAAPAPELLRWHRVTIDPQGFVTFDTDGQRRGWHIDYVAEERRLRLHREKEGVSLETSPGSAPLDATTLELRGDIAGSPARVVLHKLGERDTVLTSRGFHWVNERPYWR